jgi:hypothetical protein
MKVEVRRFKFATHLLLISESVEESKALDEILGDCAKEIINVRGILTSDDAFNPYLSFVKRKSLKEK